ncbi:MAG TPA: hypothetical protein PLF08_03115 [Bacillota bacterium]|nr:hypothetical protein [Candidatus Fermentithermobacillaceae bacterium]HOB30344.1 hypothetical protein [Bacillota bacterium]HOK64407.1 hypothetical protein [Bacillota bacterium]HOQ02953.1 hypothetical protein [Bacillota bacterium]HPV13246.1 hypothetical protein [Bacillota bacterium]
MYTAVKLRTGFYETTCYFMEVKNEQVVLSPCNPEPARDTVIIDKDYLISVFLTRSKLPELSFETTDGLYICILGPDLNIYKLLTSLENALDVKVVVRTP